MQETQKPEYKNNEVVKETRELIYQMEQAGMFDREHFIRQKQVKISKAHRLVYYLLTSKELGYKDVHIEVPILNHISNADLYIGELNLVVNVDGPSHFYLDEPYIRIPKLTDRFID